MIKLNAKDDHVEVTITGNGKDFAEELHALLETIQESEDMQTALMIAIAYESFFEKEHSEKSDGIREMLKKVFEKGKNNENIKS